MYDYDGNGSLTWKEVKAMVVQQGFDVSAAKRWFKRADDDNSKSISYAEFRDAMLVMDMKEQQQQQQQQQQQSSSSINERKQGALQQEKDAKFEAYALKMHKLKKDFKALDTDDSGSIERSEVIALFQSRGKSVAAAKKFFAAADADGSKTVSWSEYRAYVMANEEMDE
jgi:Ca2+-binding EF-hand superfamily protein